MKMKKLLKNAVVYALAASMLVSTPLTASAGLVDAYKVTDGSKDVSGDPEEPTGTVTNTYTDTSVLNEYDAQIIGISLDQTYVKTEKGEEPELRATVLFDGSVPEAAREEANKLIRWETSDLWTVSIRVEASDRTVAYLTPRKGTKLGQEVKIKASIGNLDDENNYNFDYTDEAGEVHHIEGFRNYYSAEAEVYVKEYTEWLTIDGVATEQFMNHKLDLSGKLNRHSETANDTITWSSSDTSVAKVSAAGVVTFQKLKGAKLTNGANVTITAAGEKADKNNSDVTKRAYATVEFHVTKGVAATSVTITNATGKDSKFDSSVGKDKKGNPNKGTVDLGTDNGDKSDHTVTLTAKMLPDGTNDTQATTDVIEWTSSKTAIVEVISYTNDETAKTSTVQLKPKKAGKSTITAKASNGKKATFTLTVKATLNSFEIIGYTNGDYYTGQILQLDVKRNPAVNTTKIGWALTDKDSKDQATLSSKGVLKLKTKAKDGRGTVNFTATPKSADINGKKEAQSGHIIVVQSEVNSIKVKDDVTTDIVASVQVNKNGKVVKNTSDRPTGSSKLKIMLTSDGYKGRTFTASVDDAAIPTGKGAQTLNWKTSSAKVATVEPNGDGTAKITALKKGKAKITVSGVYKKGNSYKAINATFNVNVTQPITSLTMNKTSTAVKASSAKQTVTLKATKNKNATGTVTWAIKYADGRPAPSTVSVNKSGKVTFAKNNGCSAGDVFVVTATADTGVKARTVINVVSATKSVLIKDKETSAAFKEGKSKNTLKLAVGEKREFDPAVVNVGTGTTEDKAIWLKPGEKTADGKQAAKVTYSFSKTGIVTVVNNTIYRIGTGKVTVTVKTADGKSYKLTVK